MNIIRTSKAKSFSLATALCCMLILATLSSQAEATTILDISGTDDTGQITDADEGVAASFTLTQAFSNVSITAPTSCTFCSGGVYLMKNAIGPTATIADVIAANVFTPSSQIILFTGLNLSAGDYFVVLTMDDGITGAAGWSGSTTPTISSLAGIIPGFDYRVEDVNQGFPGQSNFTALLGNDRLFLTVTADVPTAVPTPSTVWLFISALAGFGFIRALLSKANCVRLNPKSV